MSKSTLENKLTEIRQILGDKLYNQLTREQLDTILKTAGSIDIKTAISRSDIKRSLKEQL